MDSPKDDATSDLDTLSKEIDHTDEREMCMICMTEIVENGLVLPTCVHSFHVECALTAIQYDNRCPVCRTPSVEAREYAAPSLFTMETSYEDLVLEQENSVRTYNRRKSRVIKRSVSLSKLQQKLKDERSTLRLLERDIDRAWFKLQKELWSQDEHIQTMKGERKKRMRRMRYFEKKIGDRILPLIGDEPQLQFFLS